jgi:hypothetical protein
VLVKGSGGVLFKDVTISIASDTAAITGRHR